MYVPRCSMCRDPDYSQSAVVGAEKVRRTANTYRVVRIHGICAACAERQTRLGFGHIERLLDEGARIIDPMTGNVITKGGRIATQRQTRGPDPRGSRSA